MRIIFLNAFYFKTIALISNFKDFKYTLKPIYVYISRKFLITFLFFLIFLDIILQQTKKQKTNVDQISIIKGLIKFILISPWELILN